MVITQKIKHELESVVLATMFFAVWFGGLLTIKWLILLEYDLGVVKFTKALVGALVVAKVVVLLERVRFGPIPAWVDVLIRTLVYSAGVIVVLLVERGIEGRQEAGGFSQAVLRALEHSDANHIAVNTIVVFAALMGYNALAVLRQHLGRHGLLRIFTSPMADHRPADAETVQGVRGNG